MSSSNRTAVLANARDRQGARISPRGTGKIVSTMTLSAEDRATTAKDGATRAVAGSIAFPELWE